MTANITFHVCANITPGGALSSTLGAYYRLGTVGADTTLFDCDLYANGYWRAKLTALGHYVVEAVICGASFSVDGGAITQAAWIWLCTSFSADTSSGHLALSVAVYDQRNALVNRNFATAVFPPGNTGISIPATLGDGKSRTSTYGDLPDTALFRRSKLYLSAHSINATTPPYQHLVSPPTSDIVAGASVEEFYNARQPSGAAASITDGSATGAAFVPTSTYTIWRDGPFVS